jgi:hypothetical protein
MRVRDQALPAVITAAVLLGAPAVGVAEATPTPSPAPGPSSGGSTIEEITDMVMGAIQRPATPTTTPVPTPPG